MRHGPSRRYGGHDGIDYASLLGLLRRRDSPAYCYRLNVDEDAITVSDGRGGGTMPLVLGRRVNPVTVGIDSNAYRRDKDHEAEKTGRDPSPLWLAFQRRKNLFDCAEAVNQPDHITRMSKIVLVFRQL